MSHDNQDESDTLCDTFSRLDRFRVSQNITWRDVARRLGVSVSTIMMVKTGQRNLGKKPLFKLNAAEIEAGISHSKNVPVRFLNDSNSSPMMNLTEGSLSIKKLKILDLRDDVAALNASLEMITKTVKAIHKRVWELEKD